MNKKMIGANPSVDTQAPYTPYKELSDDMCNRVIPPKIEAMMSGAVCAMQDNQGNITLHYSDRTNETHPCPELEIAATDNFFAIVSTVQAKRNKS